MDGILWADLHNHNAVGYGRGSIERAMEIARSRLDVWGVTPHAAWPDLPVIEGGRHEKWRAGFEVVKREWPRLQRLVAETNQPGRFVAILGYEWHSTACGDYCLYYPGDEGELYLPDTLEELQAHARRTGALLIPHHLAYSRERRGVQFERVEPDVTPVIEIYSEHGGSERDRGPFPMYGHSFGGRDTANTLQWALAQGLRVGVTAGTDEHLGAPGAYGEGLTAILSAERTREAVFAALRARRCYGVTGDRIQLDFHVNGAPMGSEIGGEGPNGRESCVSGCHPQTVFGGAQEQHPQTRFGGGTRRIEVRVDAPDELDRVEVVRNNRVIHRWFPDDAPATAGDLAEPVRCRIEFGWGPWSDLGLDRVADWDIAARIDGGRILDAEPCFQSGPFDEARRHRIVERSETRCRWVSYTSRRQAFNGIPTNAVVLTLAGGAEAALRVETAQPASGAVSRTLGGLLVRDAIHFTGPFPAESLMIHRLVPQRMSRAEFAIEDDGAPGDWYYVRVTETNGHAAWSSPAWCSSR